MKSRTWAHWSPGLPKVWHGWNGSLARISEVLLVLATDVPRQIGHTALEKGHTSTISIARIDWFSKHSPCMMDSDRM